MSGHIPDAGKIPADGCYICLVIQDTGGEVARYVRVLDGRPFLPSGHAVLPSACSHFRPVHSWEFCGNWPDIAGHELDALRTANAALVERVKRLEEAGDAMLNAWLMPEDAMEYSDWVALSSDAKRNWYRAKATP